MRKNVKRLLGALAGLTVLAGVFTVTAHATAAPADSATKLRVMNWNIHGGEADLGRIAEEIKAYDPDIVTLQEVMQVEGDNQVRKLESALGMTPHFGFADHPGPCDDPQEGRVGNVILTKHDKITHDTVNLPSDPDLCAVDRSMAVMKIGLDSGQSMHVFTTHLTPGLSKPNTNLRQTQAKAALDHIDHSGPVLFTGDFNARDTGTIPGWVTDAGFTDTGAEVDSGDTHRGERIDYVFSKQFTPTWGDSPSTDASDHRAVIIDLTLG